MKLSAALLIVSLPMFGALQDAVPHVMVFTPDTRVRTRLRQSATV